MLGFIAKHKKFFSLLLLFALLFWLLTVQVKSGRFLFMERPVLAVSGLIERIIVAPFHFVEYVINGYLFLVHTEKENGRLKEEVDRLKIENAVSNELIIENQRLRELLGFRTLHPPASVMAQVIGKDSSLSSRTLTINKGSTDGIEKDMAVITPSGVIGRIQTAIPGTAKVILLSDPGSTIAVRVQRNREEGLLEGKLDHCALKYVSYYADIQEGDLLVTSGLDGIYPKGIPVATVVKVTKHEATAFQHVVAHPVVRFSRVEEALVLLK